MAGSIPLGQLRPRSSMAEQKHVLAIASGGGHWQQLMRLRPAFERSEGDFRDDRCRLRDRRSRQELSIRLRREPRSPAEVDTPGLPGLGADPEDSPRRGHLHRSGTRGCSASSSAVWWEREPSGSIASPTPSASLSPVESLRRLRTFVLTQWPHLAEANGPQYHGSIL